MIENSIEAFDAIEHIKTLKPKDKEAYLHEQMVKSQFFTDILKAAYDPFITYGVKKIPKYEQSTKGEFFEHTPDDQVGNLLWELSQRTLTGNQAQDAIAKELERLDAKSAELLKRILKKDLRAGFTAKTVNRAVPGTIYVFECMKAQKYEEKRIKEWPVFVEPKYDGVRALCLVQEDGASFHTREGRMIQGHDALAKSIHKHLTGNKGVNVILDGELISEEGFNEIVGAIHRKDSESKDSIFMVFDTMTEGEFLEGESFYPYKARRGTVGEKVREMNLPNVKATPSYIVNSHGEIEHIYQSIRDKGGEGVIVKLGDGRYQAKRSYNWLKIKDRQTLDLPIVGFEEGTGKNENKLGAVIVELGDLNPKVGGGFTDIEREEIWNNQDDYVGKLIEVEFHEHTPDGNLRHPRFLRFRDDKPIEDGAGV